MYKIKLILENGVEVVIADVEDDEVKIAKIQMKCKKLAIVCIRTENEQIYMVKEDINLIGYSKDLTQSTKTATVNSGLYA